MSNETPFNDKDGFRRLIELTNGLTLAQVCSLTQLESSTIQNWVKRGFVPRPVGKRYDERSLARIRIISLLRDSLRLEQIGELLTIVNGDTDDTSDDIISESELYSCLCRITELIGSTTAQAAVDEVTRDYTADESSRRRLKGALTVMALACVAAQYKNQAETTFNTLKKEISL